MVTKLDQDNYWLNIPTSKVYEYWTRQTPVVRIKWFAEQIRDLSLGSFFECGFLCGRNLFHIHEVLPELNLSGIEINRTGIDLARGKLPKANLMEKNIYDLGMSNDQYDMVFTCGVLVHIIPEDIDQIIDNMIGASSGYIAHLEELGCGKLMVGPKTLNPSLGVGEQMQWDVDLVNKYRARGFSPEVIEIPSEFCTTGATSLVIVKVR